MQTCLADVNEHSLSFDFDVSDDALERAAMASACGAVTVAYCTYWHECGWPFIDAY